MEVLHLTQCTLTIITKCIGSVLILKMACVIKLIVAPCTSGKQLQVTGLVLTALVSALSVQNTLLTYVSVGV
jgi:hypothetical protein